MHNNESICICMCMHNNASSIQKAIVSVLEQLKTKRDLFLIVSDDNSTDESIHIVRSIQMKYSNILLFENNFGSATENRNWIQNLVIEKFPTCILMGRLDADDTLSDHDILQNIEQLWEKGQFDVLLMANNQILNGQATGYVNRPGIDLLNEQLILERLEKMSQGIWEAELPSCNVFVRPQIAIPYEKVKSAEDHWNLVNYLLKNDELKIVIKPNWIYSNYHINGSLSTQNQKSGDRQLFRRKLYKYAVNKIQEGVRRKHALELLVKYQAGIYHYLGAGFSGVVFHDETWVYKIHLPIATNNFNEIDNILYLKEKLRNFDRRKHFFPLKDLIKVDDYYILIYPYQKGQVVISLQSDEMISFLAEIWEMKIMCRSITKEKNFIRVDGIVKLIDYEIEPYNDNLFLNLAARAFIQLNNMRSVNINYEKLKRSTINQFHLPELEGFYQFLEKVFNTIADKHLSMVSDKISLYPQVSNLDIVHYDGVANPGVCLLIKACIQDSATLYNDVKFILEQLPHKVKFKERLLLIDTYKHNDFLRQYSDKGSKSDLIYAANQLVIDGFIHRLVLPPDNINEIEIVNKLYFGVTSISTHTINGIPVTAQLFAFNEVQCDYILQMDVDVLIGKTNSDHDFLQKPISTLRSNAGAITWGFQIFLNIQSHFQPFLGEDGTVPPDPRCCLIDKKRLLQILPLYNQSESHGWVLSWYRALQKHHQSGKSFSLRGGDTDTFYTHIQNYRKENRWVWWTIMEAYRNNLLPEKQLGLPEISGTIFDWTLPKRNEPLVLILLLNDPNPEIAKKSLLNILSQDNKDFGLIVYNNTGYNDVLSFIRQLPTELSLRITLIKSENNIPNNEAIYKAVHYYMADPESFVCLIKEGDLLLDSTVISECLNRLKLYQADVLVGKEFSVRTLNQNGMWAADFLRPRLDPESLLNGLAIFRKYLFDALSHFDLKEFIVDSQTHLPGYSKITNAYRWLNDTTALSIIVPIVEICKSPIRFDHFNLLRVANPTKDEIKKVKEFLQTHSPKVEGKWETGRRTFLPNLNRIELDITYDCNLKCLHCNRSCTQAPTTSHMSLEQIKSFVQESITLDKKWEIINVLGGEPTMHPAFEAIIHCLLYEYIIPYSPGTTLQVTSNGYGDTVQQKLSTLPLHPNVVVNTNSYKSGREIPYFTPFNLAPVDQAENNEKEYHKGCWVTAYCGIGLNHLGYFACGVAGGIERIAQSGNGIHSLAALSVQLLQKQLQSSCCLCGNFTNYAINRGDFMERAEKDAVPKTAMSDSWKRIYKQYNNERN